MRVSLCDVPPQASVASELCTRVVCVCMAWWVRACL